MGTARPFRFVMPAKKDAVKAKAGSKPVPKSTADKKAAPKAADAGKKAPPRQVKKAQSAQKKVVKGRFGTRVKKPRTSVSSPVPGRSAQSGIPSTHGNPPPRGPTWTPTTSSITPTPLRVP